eukprot:TRINITY_DN6768_c0_g1_i1.p2 TRINITY_DN6768_c0_g1~~TRINITY_DN6768_c0_g1_i1.p2  ORF type:complete len:135 (+),score=45.33 TRINITY_DN6768_c0_g1_i1:54-407(+)
MADEQATKRRKLEDGTADTTPVKQDVREGSPDAQANGGLPSMLTASPSPTRVSPSPNLTPRQPNVAGADAGEAATRSRPPSLPPRDLSPVRVPYSLQAISRSNAPERASIDLPIEEP